MNLMNNIIATERSNGFSYKNELLNSLEKYLDKVE